MKQTPPTVFNTPSPTDRPRFFAPSHLPCSYILYIQEYVAANGSRQGAMNEAEYIRTVREFKSVQI